MEAAPRQVRRDFERYLQQRPSSNRVLRATRPELPITSISESSAAAQKSREEYAKKVYREAPDGRTWLFQNKIVISQSQFLDVAFQTYLQSSWKGVHSIHKALRGKYHAVPRSDLSYVLKLFKQYSLDIFPSNTSKALPNEVQLPLKPSRSLLKPSQPLQSSIVPKLRKPRSRNARAKSLVRSMQRTHPHSRKRPRSTRHGSVSIQGDSAQISLPVVSTHRSSWGNMNAHLPVQSLVRRLSVARRVIVIDGAGISVAAGSMLTQFDW